MQDQVLQKITETELEQALARLRQGAASVGAGLTYQQYQREGRSDAEKQKYDAAARVIDEIRIRPLRDRNGNLVIAGGSGGLLAAVALGVVVSRRRRSTLR